MPCPHVPTACHRPCRDRYSLLTLSKGACAISPCCWPCASKQLPGGPGLSRRSCPTRDVLLTELKGQDSDSRYLSSTRTSPTPAGTDTPTNNTTGPHTNTFSAQQRTQHDKVTALADDDMQRTLHGTFMGGCGTQQRYLRTRVYGARGAREMGADVSSVTSSQDRDGRLVLSNWLVGCSGRRRV